MYKIEKMKKKYVKPQVMNVVYAETLMETGSVQGVSGGNHTIANGGQGEDTDEVDAKQNTFSPWDTWEE